MRLKLVFEVSQKEFPKDYRRFFMSFIKQSLNEVDPEFFEKNYGVGKKVSKPFTFAIYFVRPKFEKDTIQLEENRVTMNISFGSYEYGIRFYNGFVQQLQNKFSLNDHSYMSLKSITLSQEKKISEKIVRIKTLSPIIVRHHEQSDNKKDRYIKYSDEEFVEQLKITILSNVQKCGYLEAYEGEIKEKVNELEIKPLRMKSVPVYHFADRLGIYLEGNIGELLLEGDSNLIEQIYKIGIGSRRSQGFGMIEVV